MSGNQERFQQAMNQGHSAAWDQMWDNAAMFYRQALEEFPDHPLALTNLGLALFELQDHERALQVYLHAARVSPRDPMPVEKAAQLFERLGNLEQAYKTYLHTAELYLKNREIHKAIENWQRVTALNPENLPAHSRLAVIFDKIGEKQKAVTEYLAVASLFQAIGEIEKATQAVNRALQIAPNNLEATQALGMLRASKQLPRPTRPRGGTAPLRMAQVRQLQEPKGEERAEASLDPIQQASGKALTMLAGMLFEGQDEEQEPAAPRRGLFPLVKGPAAKPVDRQRILLHLNHVVEAQTNGEIERAENELEKAVEAGLNHPAALYDLGYLYYKTGKADNALRNLQYAVSHPDFSLGARLVMANIFLEANRLHDASIEYLEALRIAEMTVVSSQAEELDQLYEPLIEAHREPKDADTQSALCENVRGLLVRSDWREQLQRAREQLPYRPVGSPPIPLAEILTETRSSRVIEAISTATQLANRHSYRSAMEEAFFALQHAPTYLPLHTTIGEILLKQGLLQEAIAKFTVVARAFSIRGDAQRAIDLYRRIIALAPMDATVRTRLIELLLAYDQADTAVQEYLVLADTYYNMADLDMVRKTYADALRVTQQSKVDRSRRVQILERMADIDLQSLDWRQAIRVYEQIRTLQPDHEKSRLNLIELNFKLGQEMAALGELENYLSFLESSQKTAQATAFLEMLVSENEDRIALRRRLAEHYRQQGRLQDAITQLDAVGDALLSTGDQTGALQVIEMILALNPPNRSDYQQLLSQIKTKI